MPSAFSIKAASPDATLVIAFDQTKPLLKDGKDIQYQGQTGIGPFNKNNDPSSANIGVYTFDKDNKPVFDHTQSGDVPTD